jgi:hypothetical protein
LSKSHNHAFFVYGVIVGLSIREALVKVVPHALPALVEGGAVTPADSSAQITLEAARLVTFLVVLIRLYIGAGIYFDRVYCAEASEKNFPKKNYGLDFLMGTIHFIILFVWAETIVGHNRFAHGMSGFLRLLGLVLLYDLVWWVLSADYDTVGFVRRWAILNLFTVVVSLLILLLIDTWALTSDKTAEILALCPVFVMSVVDFGEMFGGKNALTSKFAEWFRPPAGTDS